MRSFSVAALICIASVACGGEDVTEPATSSTSPAGGTTTASDQADDAAVEVVVSALDAKNRFDLDAWLSAFEGGSRTGTPLHAENILMNAKQHWEIVEPCHVTGHTGDGQSVVECVISNTDDFWGAGGIFDTKNQMFLVNEDGLITNKNNFASGRRNSFNQAFHQWLSEAHPDVYAEMDLGYISIRGPGFDAKNADHMLTAVEHVEEFVAQSDEYPLNPTDQ